MQFRLRTLLILLAVLPPLLWGGYLGWHLWREQAKILRQPTTGPGAQPDNSFYEEGGPDRLE